MLIDTQIKKETIYILLISNPQDYKDQINEFRKCIISKRLSLTVKERW